MKINSTKFNNIVNLLRDLSETSDMLHRHACALVLGGKIVAMGINTYVRNSKHAEINAIENFIKREKEKLLKRCILIVIRLGRDGEVQSSKPCSTCVPIIKQYGIKRVFYSVQRGFEFEKGDNIQSTHLTLSKKLEILGKL